MTTVLVVDLAALLDSSKVGAAATAELEKAWKDSQTLPEAQRNEVLSKLQAQRDALRGVLLARSKPLLDQLAKSKKADLVLEKGAVLWGAAEDVTQALIDKVDAGGPLKI